VFEISETGKVLLRVLFQKYNYNGKIIETVFEISETGKVLLPVLFQKYNYNGKSIETDTLLPPYLACVITLVARHWKLLLFSGLNF
jgi:hypothetical protein